MSHENKQERRRGEIRDRAYRLLALRAHARAELEQKLFKKHKEPQDAELVSSVLDELEELGYLDDEVFADAFVQESLRRRPVSRALLRKRLEDKGVSEGVAAAAIESLYSPELEHKLASDAAHKKYSTILDPASKNVSAIIGRHLSSKGFSADVIFSVLEEMDLTTSAF